ncbi:HAD family hydrolase [Paenibacillus sp. FSL M8-0334]|uniref:HAD family hydrolase n=1 Tax=Paenibacillus sp. FSL M8-0334 TaxID=2921623 RepID=UPI0030F77ECD
MNMAQLYLNELQWQVEAVFLDKDGTLIDFMHTWGYWAEQALRQYAIQLAEQGYEAAANMPARIGMLAHGADVDRNGPLAMGTVAQLETILTFSSYELGMPWFEAIKVSRSCLAYADKAVELERRVRLLPGAGRFLEEAARLRIPMFIVTADETDTAVKQMQWLGMAHYFTDIIGTDQVVRGKPYPDMLELAAGRHQVDLTRAVMIGDTSSDMSMAHSAGLAVRLGKLSPGGSVITHATSCFADYGQLTITA